MPAHFAQWLYNLVLLPLLRGVVLLLQRDGEGESSLSGLHRAEVW